MNTEQIEYLQQKVKADKIQQQNINAIRNKNLSDLNFRQATENLFKPITEVTKTASQEQDKSLKAINTDVKAIEQKLIPAIEQKKDEPVTSPIVQLESSQSIDPYKGSRISFQEIIDDFIS